MNRREAAVVLWAAAGMYAMWSGFSRFESHLELILLPPSAGSVMSRGVDRFQVIMALMMLLSLVLVVAGVLLLRERTALAGWLFREGSEEEAPVPAAPAATGASANEAPAAAGGAAAAGRAVTAQEVCQVAVAGLGLWIILNAVRDLSWWMENRIFRPLSTTSDGTLLGTLLFGILGALVLRRRERIAAWVLRREVSAGSSATAAAMGLFGLFLMLWYTPWLAIFLAALVASHGSPSALARGDLQGVLSFLLGLSVFLGHDGFRSVWNKVRSRTAEDGDQGSEATDR